MLVNTKLKFEAKISELLPLESVTKIAVAVSGGSDSLSLLKLLTNHLQRHEIEIFCLTVNHNLRNESLNEALFVQKICQKLNVKHQILDWSGEKPSVNIQHKARQARYKLLTDFCKNNQIKFLLTAHHEMDQAENFLIRLEHGSGINGLAGIDEKSEQNSIILIRPLLDFSKEELRSVLIDDGIEWVEDPTNDNLKYTRTKFRKILSQNRSWIKKINLASQNLKRAKEVIDYYLEHTRAKLIKSFEKDLAFDQDEFNILPQEIKFRLITYLIRQTSNANIMPRGERVENLIVKLQQKKDFKAATLGKCLFKRKKNQIIVTQENS